MYYSKNQLIIKKTTILTKMARPRRQKQHCRRISWILDLDFRNVSLLRRLPSSSTTGQSSSTQQLNGSGIANEQANSGIRVDQVQGCSLCKCTCQNTQAQQETAVNQVPETEFIRKDLIDIDASNNRSKPVIDELSFEQMHHLLLLMYDTFDNFSSRARRILSVVLFGTVRLARVSFRNAKEILEQLPVLTPEVCQSWLKRIVKEKDIRKEKIGFSQPFMNN
jgi:hypothetical protein